MVRLFFYFSLVCLIFSFFSFIPSLFDESFDNDPLTVFLIFLVISAIFYFIDRAKRKIIDTVLIVIFWGISLFISFYAVMVAAWTGDSATMVVFVFILNGLLLFLTLSNNKLNTWLKRKPLK